MSEAAKINLTLPATTTGKQKEGIERIKLESSRVYQALFGPFKDGLALMPQKEKA